jgi:hypothetical protein
MPSLPLPSLRKLRSVAVRLSLRCTSTTGARKIWIFSSPASSSPESYMVNQVHELPTLLRPVTIAEMAAFFEAQARAVIERG